MKRLATIVGVFLSVGITSNAWAAVESVPEPSLLLLMAAGFLGFVGLGKKLKR